MTKTNPSPSPNPKRVAAGKRNQSKRKGLTPEGRRRVRAAALAHQPWRFATGPRTPEGKARSAANGRKRQMGASSVRQLRAEFADVDELINQLSEARATALKQIH